MAFRTATGYANLPNGNFSPVIFSKKAQKAFRKTSVVEDITNTDYMGEISNYGDSVRIMKEPEIVVSDYSRGQIIRPQDLEDDDFTLIVDQAKSFAFAVDDIEKKHSHVNFETLASDRAAYVMRDEYDKNVLAYMSGFDVSGSTWTARTTANGTKAMDSADADELLAANKLDFGDFGGTGGNSIAISSTGASSTVTVLSILNRFKRLLDAQNVPQEDRYVILDPIALEVLGDENSKLVSNDYAGGQDAGDLLRNGRVYNGLLRGFKVYMSNNLPVVGSGAGTTASSGSTTNYGVIVAGHKAAVATASQITQTESFRSPDSFADIVRGLQVFGRKILRPEAILTAKYNLA